MKKYMTKQKSKIKGAIDLGLDKKMKTGKRVLVALSRYDWSELDAKELIECLLYADSIGIDVVFVSDADKNINTDWVD